MHTHEDGALRLIKVGLLGPFANNAYIIADAGSGEALIVDMPARPTCAGTSCGSRPERERPTTP